MIETHIVGRGVDRHEGQLVVGNEQRTESSAVALAERRQHDDAVRRAHHELAWQIKDP